MTFVQTAFAWLFERALVDPIVRKELYGVSRRWLTYAGRSFYLLVLLLVVWAVWSTSGRFVETMTYSDYARIGRYLFVAFGWTQLILILLASIVQSADMISKEVRNDTLGVLFLTPLRPIRIVLGKWKACMGYLSLILLSGLPILAIAVFLGGVDPLEFLAVAALTLSTCSFCVSFALYMSSFFKGGYGGLICSVLGLFAYGALPAIILEAVVRYDPDYMPWLAFQNPVVAMAMSMREFGPRFQVSEWAWAVNSGLHVFLTLVLLYMTADRLSRVARADRRPPLFRRIFDGLDRLFEMKNWLGRKLVGGGGRVWERSPYLWKELHARATGKFRYMTRICVVLLVLLVLGVLLFAEDVMEDEVVMVALGAMVTLFILMAIGSSASSFAKEREERKWDLLMTTPATAGQLLGAKLGGSLIGLAPIAVVMMLYFFVPWIGWQSVAGIVPLYVATFLFVFFVVVAGMFVSLRCRTTRKAYALTLTIVVGLLAGIPLILGLLEAVAEWGLWRGRDSPAEMILQWTNPFMYMEHVQRGYRSSHYYGYGYGEFEFPTGPLAVFCVIYITASISMLVHMALGFDRMANRE